MKEIVNIFTPILNENQKKAFIAAAEVEKFNVFNSRNTITEGKNFNVIEFPDYSGFDTHKRKAMFDLLSDYFLFVGYVTAQEENTK